MKTIIPTIAIAAFAMMALSHTADARPHHRGKHKGHDSHIYVSGYRACGTPVYHHRYIRSYRRCGTPVWGYRVVPPPRRHYVAPRHVRRACPPPPCPPPVYHHRPSGNRVIIQGVFGF